MTEENIYQGFRLKKLNKTKNCFNKSNKKIN